MNLIFRKVVAVAGLMPLCMVASAGNMGAGEVHAVFNGLEWQKGNGKLLVQFVKPAISSTSPFAVCTTLRVFSLKVTFS